MLTVHTDLNKFRFHEGEVTVIPPCTSASATPNAPVIAQIPMKVPRPLMQLNPTLAAAATKKGQKTIICGHRIEEICQ